MNTKKHLRGNYAKSGWLHNRKEKYVKSLPAIAIDEYDSFLDDLSFETCGDENLENPSIKKNKKNTENS